MGRRFKFRPRGWRERLKLHCWILLSRALARNSSTPLLQSILSVRRWKMVVWGSFRPFLSSFLSSLGTRGVPTPFSFFFSCSPCAEEFVLHFLLQFFFFFLGRWVQPLFYLQKVVTSSSLFFPRKKNFFRKKNHFGVFSWSWKNMCGDFQGEQNLRKNAEQWKHCLLFPRTWLICARTQMLGRNEIKPSIRNETDFT